MNDTQVLKGARARKKILKGVNLIYETVKLTLGPEGKNALLPRTFNRGPRITNDGITIAELAKLTKDEHVRLAAESFIEGSKKTNEIAGDGTTGTAVIGGYLINQIFNEMPDSDIPVPDAPDHKSKGVRAMRAEMKEAKDIVIAEIKKQAKPIKTQEDLENIAIVSIGKEDAGLAKKVAEITWEIARDANGDFVDNHIDVVEGYKGEVEVEKTLGMKFPAKVAHRAFVTRPERFEMVAEDARVFITNHKLDNPAEVAKILENCKATKIAIFSPEFSDQVVAFFSAAIQKGWFTYPVKCPALRTEQLEDLAVYTGATVIDKTTGMKLDSVNPTHLGFAAKITVKDTENREDAHLIGGQGTKIDERQGVLKQQLGEARNELTKLSLERRIANLASATGIIRVGASTDNEALYLKLKIEDAVFACKAALQEGFVKGGGLCLKSIAEKLPKNILTSSLLEPHSLIQRNAGGDLKIGKDIIDPAKVVRLEVEHGVSVAAQMITTDISIPELREKSPAEGYESIAQAIDTYTYLQGKHLGLLKENVDYQNDMDEKAFDRAMLMDKD